MQNDWRDVHLEDVADLTVGHVGPMVSEYVPSGVPFLRSQNIERFRVNRDEMKFITRSFHERLRKSALTPGDVVIVRTGKPGSCAVIPKSMPEANCSDLVIVHCGPELDPRFLAYFVNTAATHHVSAFLVGAVQQHFNVASARRILLRLPSLTEQRAVVDILGALDSKIELNSQMSGTLEALTHALFKAWFVNFEPVRAKAAGRHPAAMNAATEALFPDSFEDSPLGPIPSGWRVTALGDICERRLDRMDATASWSDETLIDLRRMPRKSVSLVDWGVGRELQTSVVRFARRDTLFGAIRPYFHKVGFAPTEGVTNTSVFVLRAKRDRASWGFLVALASSPEAVDFASQVAKGTKMPVVGWDDFAQLRIPLPTSPDLMNAFAGMVEPFLLRMEEGIHESRTLAELRDTLLPKLLSGELRVRDAAREVEAAV